MPDAGSRTPNAPDPIPPTPWPQLCDAGDDADVAIAFDDGTVLRYGDLRDAIRRREQARGGTGKRLVALVAEPTADALTLHVAALAAGDAVVLLPPDQPAMRDAVLARFDPHELAWHGPDGWRVTVRHDRPLALAPDLALLLSTSGSTGEAKFVRLSVANLAANATGIAEYLGLDRHERGLLNLPPHYSYGLSILHSHLVVGARVLVSARSVTDDALWRFFDDQGGTSLPGVPHTYQLLEAGGFFGRRHPTLRTLTQAGGRLDEGLARRVAQWSRDHGVRFFMMYGQTEAGPRIAYLPPELAAEHPGRIGRAVPGGTLRLVDDRGEPITEPGIEGELHYEGPNVMMGYAVEAADLARAAGPPVLATGDLAVREPSGLLRITGRRSRFVKLFGLRVSADAVEQALAAQGLTAACAGGDDRLGLLVVGDAAAAADAARRVATQLSVPPTAVHARAVDALPRLPSGKVDQRRVTALLQAAAPSPAPAGAGRRLPAEAVRAAFAEAFPDRTPTDDDSFTTLGGDSLRYVGLAIALERLVPALPRGWETLTLAELARLARTDDGPTPRTPRLDTSIVLRAVGVLCVVANHAGVGGLAGGAAMLLMVAGVNAARFQLGHLLDGDWRSVARGFVTGVLLPYWLAAGLYGLLRGGVNLPDLLLVGNYAYGRSSGDSGFETWFVQVLAQSLAVLVLATRWPALRRRWRDRPFAVALALLGAAVVLRLAEPLLFPVLQADGGRELPWQFWEFALGLAVFAAATPTARATMAVLTVALPATLYLADPPRALLLGLGGLVLLAAPRLPVPAWSAPGWRVLASASLFIYMLHGHAPTHSPTASWPVDLVRIAIGVALGLAGWKAYETVDRIAGGWWRRRTRADSAPAASP